MIQGPSLPSAWTWTSTQSPTLGGGVLGADTEVSEIFDTGGTPESSQSLDQLN